MEETIQTNKTEKPKSKNWFVRYKVVLLVVALLIMASVATAAITILIISHKVSTNSVINTTNTTNANQTNTNVNEASVVTNTNQESVNENTNIKPKPVNKNTNTVANTNNKPVNKNTDTTANTNQAPVNNNTTTNTPTAVDPTIKIELCKSQADTAQTAAITPCTDSLMAAFKADPNYAVYLANIDMANKQLKGCNSTAPDVTDPYLRQPLIDQCISTNQSMITSSNKLISSLKSKYLAGLSICTDAIYQRTYTACLSK